MNGVYGGCGGRSGGGASGHSMNGPYGGFRIRAAVNMGGFQGNTGHMVDMGGGFAHPMMGRFGGSGYPAPIGNVGPTTIAIQIEQGVPTFVPIMQAAPSMIAMQHGGVYFVFPTWICFY